MHYYKEPNSLYAYTDSGVEEITLTLAEIADICEAYEAAQFDDALREELGQ